MYKLFPPLPRALTVATALCLSGSAHAWVLGITAGIQAVYLAVGNATPNGANATINLVNVAVTPAALTTGVAQPMASNSTQANSPLDNFNVCSPAAGQVYVGGFYRLPGAAATTAVMQVTTPAGLTSGANVIPFNKISWTSTALGNAAADIPAGTFVSGGTLFLRNFAANTYVENCHTFNYANTNVVAAGTYNGQATYTLTAP